VLKSEPPALCSDGALKISLERPPSGSLPSVGLSSPKTRRLWPRPMTWPFAARWKLPASNSLMRMAEAQECAYASGAGQKR